MRTPAAVPASEARAVAMRLAEAATQDLMPLQAREVGGMLVAREGLRAAVKADPGLVDRADLDLLVKADLGLVDKGALDPAVKVDLGLLVKADLGLVDKGALDSAVKVDLGPLVKADLGLVDKGGLDPAVKVALGWVDGVAQDRVAPTQGATVARTIHRPPVRKIRRAK